MIREVLGLSLFLGLGFGFGIQWVRDKLVEKRLSMLESNQIYNYELVDHRPRTRIVGMRWEDARKDTFSSRDNYSYTVIRR